MGKSFLVACKAVLALMPARARACAGRPTAAAMSQSRFLLLLLVLTLLGFSRLVGAVPQCLVDVDGPNDPTGDGQVDITRLCTDNDNLVTTPLPVTGSFDVYMSWDEIAFSGANTGDACVLFDTNGDPGGNIDYAICISVGGSPASLSAGPLIYSCDDSADNQCNSPVSITPSGATTCAASVQSVDPFPAGDGYPNDTVGVCTIDVADIPPDAIRTNLCSFPSTIPNSAPKDCVGVVGGGFITIEKIADPDDGTNFSFTLDGQTYTISGSGTQLVSLPAGTGYAVAETLPANWALSSASCVDNSDNSSVGTFNNVETVSGLTLTTGDDFTCTFSNVQIAELVTTKVVDDSTPDEGQSVTFTITVANNGAVQATNVSLTDLLPAGITYTGNVVSQGGYVSGTGVWSVGTLNSGANATLDLTGTIDAGQAGNVITNSTTAASGDQNDPDLVADDLDEAVTVNATQGPELTLVKSITGGDPYAAVGDVINYSFAVSNSGKQRQRVAGGSGDGRRRQGERRVVPGG
jgi:uncharacterized repeat protein (TIGR01451 family)